MTTRATRVDDPSTELLSRVHLARERSFSSGWRELETTGDVVGARNPRQVLSRIGLASPADVAAAPVDVARAAQADWGNAPLRKARRCLP